MTAEDENVVDRWDHCHGLARQRRDKGSPRSGRTPWSQVQVFDAPIMVLDAIPFRKAA